MKSLILCSIALIGLLFSLNSAANITDSPEERIDNYWKNMCVARYTNNCVNEVCITSEERHCHQNCREAAFDICKEELGF